MTNIDRIIERVAAAEARFRETQFLAPCVRNGRVRARISGMVQAFQKLPRDFEGWALFRADTTGIARVESEAAPAQIAAYLGLFPALRLLLVRPLAGSAWLAYPANESDAAQRRFLIRPVAVHLVTEGAPFEPIVARRVGEDWWFEEIDRRADALLPERMREAFVPVTQPEELRLPGLTPEMRTAYALAAQRSDRFAVIRAARIAQETWRANTDDRTPSARLIPEIPRSADERRVQDALRLGGGSLRSMRDRGDYWQVDWTTRDGQYHTSAISRRDLTVLSAGICLSDRDRDFDLQSLVGVVERWR